MNCFGVQKGIEAYIGALIIPECCRKMAIPVCRRQVSSFCNFYSAFNVSANDVGLL